MITASATAADLERRRAMRRFILFFLGIFLIFEVIIYTVLVSSGLYQTHLDWNARMGGAVLGMFFSDVTVTRNLIHGPSFSIAVEIGCDILQPSAVFLAGVLSFPVPGWLKLVGAVVGILVLAIVNIGRIASLYAIGVHYPDLFHLAHVELWQGAFIILALLLWIIWMKWADRYRAGSVSAAK